MLIKLESPVRTCSEMDITRGFGPRIPGSNPGRCIKGASEGGYGLVVEHVLAKDETGVQFSLPALSL